MGEELADSVTAFSGLDATPRPIVWMHESLVFPAFLLLEGSSKAAKGWAGGTRGGLWDDLLLL